MQTAKEKMKNMTSAAKEKVDVYKANAQEKAEKATAATHEEKVIAKEKRKAKEAQAKANLHADKADHAAEKLDHGHRIGGGLTRPGVGHRHQPVGTVAPGTGTTVPSYPLGGHPPGYNTNI